MNKYATILPLLLSTSLFIQGCGESSIQGSQATAKTSLTTFLSVHDKFCAGNFTDAEQLSHALDSDPGFELSENHEGIYEKLVADVSYAVSPEESGCTTDLKIKTASSSKPYFGFEEINTALLGKGYKTSGKKEIRTELGLDNKELKVIEQKYVSDNDKTVSTLVFPLEREDQYYMTLYVEKFEMQGASLGITADTDLVEI